MLRCRSIASLQRTVSTLHSSIFRAPRIWIFLSSLQETFFNTLLGVIGSIAASQPGSEEIARFSTIS
jgi:hypothetical protein